MGDRRALHEIVELDLAVEGLAVARGRERLFLDLVTTMLDAARLRSSTRRPRLGLRRRDLGRGTHEWVVFVEDAGPLTPAISGRTRHDQDLWAAAEAIATELGGRFRVESAGRCDGGAVAWVTLGKGARSGRERSSEDVSLSGLRVLVVDDNRINLAVLEGLLRRWGCRVVVAEDGHQATLAVGRQRFDLVLMDLQMPVMDGYSATRWIRSQPAPISSMPVVAISANAMPADRDRSKKAGVDAHVAKPVHAGRLEKLLKNVIQRKAGVAAR